MALGRRRRARATLGWVHWYNTARLHSYTRDVPPAEFETAFYAAQPAAPAGSWKPIARASIRPRAIQIEDLVEMT